jgi:hypothetical protein
LYLASSFIFSPRSRARLSFLCFAVREWLGQCQDNERFAGHGADVVVQAHYLDAGDLLDQRLHERLRRFDQMGPYLLEQVPPFLGREFGKLLFGGCQQTLEPDDDEIAEQVGVNVLGASAPVFLLKATDLFADGGLDLSLSFHPASNSETVAKICSTFPKSPGLTKW